MVEEQIINKILNNKDFSIIEKNNLNEIHFISCSKEFIYIKNHYNMYHSVCDRESFQIIFKDFPIIEVNETDSYLLDELFKNYKRSEIIKTYNNIKDNLLNNDIDIAINKLKNLTNNIDIVGTGLKSIDLFKDTSRYEEYLKVSENKDNFFISTGFKELDNIIGGIDKKEELAVIIARTNRGKSWILLKIATYMASQGLNVGLFSGEMTARKVGYRMDTLLGNINNGGIIHGNKMFQEEYKKYIDKLKDYKGSLKVITPQDFDGPVGVNALSSFIEKENLDVLFIDQIPLLEDDRGAKNSVDKLTNISKDLKLLQVLKQIPIISVAQQNRQDSEKENVTIGAETVSGAYRISQDATLMLGITRDKKDESLLTIHILKTRDSVAGGKITYKTDLNKGLFYYIPNEEKEEDIIQENNGDIF